MAFVLTGRQRLYIEVVLGQFYTVVKLSLFATLTSRECAVAFVAINWCKSANCPAHWTIRGTPLSSGLARKQCQAAQARKSALWAFCVTPGNPWMFVMRPIIHSTCSVSAESPHCSPTIERWGAFNPTASRRGRRLCCDIMHGANILNGSPLTHFSDCSISKSADYKRVGTDTWCLVGWEWKGFRRDSVSSFHASI